jgi:hypothetical protein
LRVKLLAEEMGASKDFVSTICRNLPSRQRTASGLAGIPLLPESPKVELTNTQAGSRVSTNLTDKQFRGYVRHEENIPTDSELYKAGNGIENRKKRPHDEISGDAFDRQRVIVGFDQPLVERQV